jgi:hypothetical protein
VRINVKGELFKDHSKSLNLNEIRAIVPAVNKFYSNPESNEPECGLKSEIPEKLQMKNCRYLPENTLLIRSENKNEVVYESAKNSIKNLTKIKEALNKFKTIEEKNLPVRTPYIP